MKTLRVLLSEYIDHLRALETGNGRIYQERRAMENLILWLGIQFDIQRADQLQELHLRTWWNDLAQRRTAKGYPIKPKTRNRMIADARRFMRYLTKRYHVAPVLLECLEYVKTTQTLPGSVLVHAQVKRMFRRVNTQSPRGFRDRTLLEFLYTTGVRVNELCGLDVGDIELDRCTAKVMGKGRKERMVPIGATALRFLQSYLRAVRSGLLKDKAEQALFVNDDGVRVRDYTVRRVIARYAGQVPSLDVHVTPHTFRRSCTTELIRGGANLYHVKELLGHERLDTLAPYTRLTILDLQKTHAKCHPREKDERD